MYSNIIIIIARAKNRAPKGTLGLDNSIYAKGVQCDDN